jgi:hypothetical protein
MPAEKPMTSSRHIVALLQCHVEGNDEQFLTIAMQAAASEARQGHGKLAQQLRELADEARARGKIAAKRSAGPVPPAAMIVSLPDVSCMVAWPVLGP